MCISPFSFLRLSLFLLLFNGFVSISYAEIEHLSFPKEVQKLLLSDSLEAAYQLNKLGMTYYRQGKYQHALFLFKRILDIGEKKLGVEHIDIATILNNLAMVYNRIGTYHEVETLYQRALGISEKRQGVEHPATALCLNNLAAFYDDMGEYSKAEPLYQRALKIFEKKLGADSPYTALSLNNLGLHYKEMGAYSRVEPLYQRALEIIEKQPKAEKYAKMVISLNNLAVLYQEMGRYSKAEEHHQLTLDIFEKHLGFEHPNAAASLNGFALLYQEMGVYSEAEKKYQHALAIVQQRLGDEHPYMATTLHNLGILYQVMGLYNKAEKKYQHALAIKEKKLGTEHPSTASTLDALGLLYKEMKLYNKAESLLQRALSIQEKKLGAEHPNTVITLSNLGLLYHTMGIYNKAEKKYQHALSIVKKQLGVKHLNTTIILNNYAWLLKQQNRPKVAVFFNKHAINALQSSRKKNIELSKALKSSFIGSKETLYRSLVTWLLNQNRLQEAEHVMAMYKEKEVADYYKKDSTLKTNRPATLIGFNAEEQPWNERYQKITEALYANHSAYKKLKEKEANKLTKKEQQRIIALEKTLAKNMAYFRQFLKDINQPWAKNPTEQVTSKIPNALQNTLAQLGEGVVIVNYFVENDKLRILLTTPTTRILRESTISAKALGKLIKNYRDTLEQKGALRGLSRMLHKHLIAPIAQDLKQANAQTLMLSLDATLRYLPMAALHNGDSYLIERYKISVYTPAVGYQALTAAASKQPRVIAMGVTEAATISPLLSSEKPYIFKALPYVANEVNGIVHSQDKGSTGFIDGHIYLNEKAKKEVLINALSKNPFSIVHLATHFQLNKGNGYQSFLLLGEQTILPIAELYRHPEVNFEVVDLLTVSACNTGMSTALSDGSEVESFATIAQQKGAKAVLASLWAVNDRSTSELMQFFYRAWQQGSPKISMYSTQPVSKIVALQQAQQYFIQQGKHTEKPECPAIQLPNTPSCAERVRYPQQSHPYYWAAFMLMGNGL